MTCERSLIDIYRDLKADRASVEPFRKTLLRHNLKLERGITQVLQVNVGSLCNLSCRHCHIAAGPRSKEIMDLATIEQIIAYAARCRFNTIDITGGAPELNPHLTELIEEVAPLAPRIIIRSNLSAVTDDAKGRDLQELLKKHRVVIYASLPSISESQTDSQRGKGVFYSSIKTIKRLNSIGYGITDSGLELNLVSNPTGAFLSGSQQQAEKRFRHILENTYHVHFNHLYSMANVPLGRFREWLIDSNNLGKYMYRLSSSFNPRALEGLMCRTQVSISWKGYLFDCDFNLAEGLFMGDKKVHVSEMRGMPEPDFPISTGDHCYACTAGAGFT